MRTNSQTSLHSPQVLSHAPSVLSCLLWYGLAGLSSAVARVVLHYAGFTPAAIFVGILAENECKWAEAAAIYSKAAAAGSADEMLRLANCLIFGLGVQCDWKQADSLISKADELKAKDAALWRGILTAELGGWCRCRASMQRACEQWRAATCGEDENAEEVHPIAQTLLWNWTAHMDPRYDTSKRLWRLIPGLQDHRAPRHGKPGNNALLSLDSCGSLCLCV